MLITTDKKSMLTSITDKKFLGPPFTYQQPRTQTHAWLEFRLGRVAPSHALRSRPISSKAVQDFDFIVSQKLHRHAQPIRRRTAPFDQHAKCKGKIDPHLITAVQGNSGSNCLRYDDQFASNFVAERRDATTKCDPIRKYTKSWFVLCVFTFDAAVLFISITVISQQVIPYFVILIIYLILKLFIL